MSELRARLRSLRAVHNRPARRFTERPEPYYAPLDGEDDGTPQPLEALLPGDLHETPVGAVYVVRKLHPRDHTHGDGILDEWLSQSLSGAAMFSDRRLAGVDPRRCLFLDTETTGLGGAGTLVFLVGVGLFTDDSFEVRQYFLRNPGEEPGMLHALQTLLDGYDALVTFNGRNFDVPLLAMRYSLNRQRLPFDRWPNLDLLYPARRLWRRRLESCRLSSLETAILGVRRTTNDVPGALIPQLYHEYVRTGDARQMARVMYHNLNDVLSMVTLATQLCTVFTEAKPSALHCDDLLSLARWYESLSMLKQAEAAYSAALNAAHHEADRKLILESLALLLKRQDRREEAAIVWEALAALAPSNPLPRVELAKYHEWTTGDLPQAIDWTEAAIQAIQNWPLSPSRQAEQHELQRRLDRLVRKRAE
jgi:hypothetical protein